MTAINATAKSAWLRVFVPRPAARLRLFCFPHAGGSASAFRELAELLPADVELTAIQYKGRQDRYGEPPSRSLMELATEVAGAIAPRLDRPAAFLGHSMGGTVAFEAARLLRGRHPAALVRLFVSARKAPQVDMSQALRFRDDADAMTYLRALGGSGVRLLEDPELRELTLPTLRDDFRLIEEYRFVPGAPLTCPITVVTGELDRSCTLEDAQGWARHTVAGYDAHALPGGHFYLETAAEQLRELLVQRLPAPTTP